MLRSRALFLALPVLSLMAACASETPAPVVAEAPAPEPAAPIMRPTRPAMRPTPAAVPPGLTGHYTGHLRPVRGAGAHCRATTPISADVAGPSMTLRLGERSTAAGTITSRGQFTLTGEHLTATGRFANHQVSGTAHRGQCRYTLSLAKHR